MTCNGARTLPVTRSIVRRSLPPLRVHAAHSSSRSASARAAAVRGRQAAPRLTAIYPTAHTLPANHLKFYLHFSQPMRQGVFLDHCRLLDDHDQPVTEPFRETELWNEDGTRLTLWFHPGPAEDRREPECRTRSHRPAASSLQARHLREMAVRRRRSAGPRCGESRSTPPNAPRRSSTSRRGRSSRRRRARGSRLKCAFPRRSTTPCCSAACAS